MNEDVELIFKKIKNLNFKLVQLEASASWFEQNFLHMFPYNS